MSHKLMQDKKNKVKSRQFTTFQGSHHGTGKCDQPHDFAYVSDFEFFEKKPSLRDGARKMQSTGFGSSVQTVFNIKIGGLNLVGVVSNGSLSTFGKDDMLAEFGL